MGKYSIRQISVLTGIKAPTLRMWERRYHLLIPHRTATNIRYYTDRDLKLALNISALYTHGFKISRIASLSEKELEENVVELNKEPNDQQLLLDQLTKGVLKMDEEIIEALFSSSVLRNGFEKTITTLAFPLLEKVGTLWQVHHLAPPQEHFISNLIRRKMNVAIDGLPAAPVPAPSVVLFLPENELHELGLLFCYYLARKAGFRTFYLGQNVPHEDLKRIWAARRPDFLITSSTSGAGPDALHRWLKRLAADFPHTRILAGGRLLSALRTVPPRRVTVADSTLYVEEWLSETV